MQISSVGRLPLRPDACRIVIIFSLIVLVAIAAVAGYWFGAKQRARAAEFVPQPRAPSPVAPATVSVEPAADGEHDSGGIGSEKARIIRSRDSEAYALRRRLADYEATTGRLADLARERAALFRDLADARGETARYRQLVIDIESNAPPPILAGVGEPDDLKLIVGVGPVLERMLHSLGVATFRQIAHWTDRDIAEFDAKLPEFPGRIVRDQWVTQARALHQSKYGAQA
jgi:predicted flap endonuclease-1-like 5' DNA nuclease